jgi:transmembrane sensor
MNRRKFQRLCIKAISNGITDSEKLILDKWLVQSDENKKEYEKYKALWLETESNEFFREPAINREWAKLSEKLFNNESGLAVKRINHPKKSSFIFGLKPALSGAFILLLLIAGIFFITKGVKQPKVNIINAANMKTKNIQLPDGSSVYLNTGSTIKYFGELNDDTRKVELKGEAFFSVKKDERPFTITTQNAKISVLGTKFDVWTHENKTRVVVKEGKVNLSQKGIGAEGVNLLRDQLSIIKENENPTSPKQIDPEYFLKWMHGNLVFYQSSLNDATDELEKFYDVKIDFANDSLKNFTLTGTFKNNNIDSALSMICLALGLDYETQRSKYIIKSKNVEH